MSAAAKTLNISQPALSYHIAELERLTGHVLLLRGRTGVSLTEAGRLLRTHARIILDQLEAAEIELDALERANQAPSGRVRLAIISSLSGSLIPLLIERIRVEMPGIALRVMEAATNDIISRLDRGDADMAIYLTGDPSRSEQLLAREQLYFLARADDRAKRGEEIALADLGWQRLVLPALGNPLRDFMEAKARQHGIRLDVVLEVDGLNSRHTAVASGVGGTIVGAHAVTHEDLDPSLEVREIVKPRLYRPIFLGVRENLDPNLRRTMGILLRESLLKLGLDMPAKSGQSSHSML